MFLQLVAQPLAESLFGILAAVAGTLAVVGLLISATHGMYLDD